MAERRRKEARADTEDDTTQTPEGEETGMDGEDIRNEGEADAPRKLPDAPVPDEEADIDVTVEMQPGGAQTTRAVDDKREKPDMKPPTRRRAKSKRSTVYLRDIPASLVAEARHMFPEAKNNTDAVAAYMALKMGIVDDLTDEQTELLRSHRSEDPVAVMNDRLNGIERDMRAFLAMAQELELTLGFLVFDRLGYRREEATSPRDVNLLENGVEAMVARMQECTKNFRARERIRNGRPKR